MLKVTVRGLKNVQRDMKVEGARQKKALELAIRIEGYRLRKQLQKEIKAGAPGGKKFAPLSFLAMWRTGRRRRSGFNRLGRLGSVVRYDVNKNPFSMKIGFVGPKVSPKMKRLAVKHQEGFSSGITATQRKAIRFRGIKRKEIEGDLPGGMGVARFHFLKKSTRSFKTPASPIIEPFWNMHEKEAWPNIRRNFKLKMQGKRI